jgi:hypothetical protein
VRRPHERAFPDFRRLLLPSRVDPECNRSCRVRCLYFVAVSCCLLASGAPSEFHVFTVAWPCAPPSPIRIINNAAVPGPLRFYQELIDVCSALIWIWYRKVILVLNRDHALLTREIEIYRWKRTGLRDGFAKKAVIRTLASHTHRQTQSPTQITASLSSRRGTVPAITITFESATSVTLLPPTNSISTRTRRTIQEYHLVAPYAHQQTPLSRDNFKLHGAQASNSESSPSPPRRK